MLDLGSAWGTESIEYYGGNRMQSGLSQYNTTVKISANPLLLLSLTKYILQITSSMEKVLYAL